MAKWTNDPLEHIMYSRIVGKIMFIMMKIFPEGANSTKRLSRHFSNPGPNHWEEMG
jgi:hypothetical protein